MDHAASIRISHMLLAASDADHTQPECQEALLDLMAMLPNLDSAAWNTIVRQCRLPAVLDESRLREEVMALLESEPAGMQAICDALWSVVCAEQVPSHENEMLVTRTVTELRGNPEHALAHIRSVMRTAVSTRMAHAACSLNGGRDYPDYFVRRVAGNVLERLGRLGITMAHDTAACASLTATGILANRFGPPADTVTPDDERDALIGFFSEHLRIGWTTGAFVAELAAGSLGQTADFFRTARCLDTCASIDVRRQVLLMALAMAERYERAMPDDLHALRMLGRLLRLPHGDSALSRIPHAYGA